MRCAANLSRGLWKPALEPNASGRAAPPCTSSELFDAGLLYPRACGPRCWWQPAQEDGCGWERVSREHALYCLRDRWLVLVGDSQVRYWVRFIAHWLDGGVKLPRGNEHYYDDVDLLLNGGRTTLSYRFAGPDYGRYARALARPRQLEVFDAKRNRHSPANGSAASSLASGPHANRSTPDALLLASSFWHPSCDKLRELSRVYAEASLASLRRPDEGEPKGREPPLRLVAWALLGSHVGPLDKFGWPDQFWECEREAAERAEGEVALKVGQAAARAATQADARAEAMSAGEAARELEAAGRSHPTSHGHERHGHGNKPPHHQRRGGPADGRLGVPSHARVLPTARRIFDLKEIAAAPGPAEMRGALRVARPEAFRECHMLRRELYGLPGGDGVHWGPAVHDAWLQLVLNAFCSPLLTESLSQLK